MREYALPDGTPVPAELQEKIAADVRAFDAAQTPVARLAVQARKIAADLPRLRGLMADYIGLRRDDMRLAERRTVVLELDALAAMGYTAAQLRASVAGRDLIARYGMGEPGWTE